MSDIYLRTDEKEDVIVSLQMVNTALDTVRTELAAWKWIVVGTHSALQSAMAFHLSCGSDLLVAKQKDAEAWLAAHENGTPYPEMMMDCFLNLYRKIKRHPILGFRFVPKGSQGRNVKRLNRFRNEFIHFMPKGWSIPLSGLPRICLDCVDIISKLDEGSLYMRWEDETQHQRLVDILTPCQCKLQILESEYGT